MAASSRSGVSRKLWILASAVILAIALYTAGWFYAASVLKQNTLALLGSQQKRGIVAECTDAEYRGYPFRIGLFCSKVTVDDRENGISGTFGALRSAAQVYAPGHIVWELDAPSEVRTSHGFSVSTTWKSLQSSIAAKLKGVERASMVIEGSRASVVSATNTQPFDITTDRTEIHLRQNGDDLDAAISLDGTSTTAEGVAELLPKLNALVDVTLAGRAGMIDGSDPNGTALYNTKGELRSLKADLGEGRVANISGPFSFDDEGRMSGKLKLRVEKIDAWQQSLGEVFPDLASTIKTAANMLAALGGGENASLDITIRRGKVLAGGLIEIGEIPRI
ncbi:hypothetical protein F4695_002022 [Rhizobium soli]|uniref:DUF2125 domain-containing protein n=1 Tax=Rhizobium soli TaxID=424798 RepID=A0A7X0JJG5_9HYPH|nr:DUF2125 domain-containing protein [Rhizobium soli]MBB6508673.1 hypothetical protein [Rhizobium soli]